MCTDGSAQLADVLRTQQCPPLATYYEHGVRQRDSAGHYFLQSVH